MINWKLEKDKLEELILNQKVSYLKIGREYGVSGTFIRAVSKKLGILLPIRSVFPKDFKPANFGTKTKKYCINCGKEIEMFGIKYCTRKCSNEYRVKRTYQDFIDNNNNYCKRNYSPARFKEFFLKDQNYSCAVCGIANVWNDKILIFVMDHIDGDAYNNKRENLRLVCPNCDSQLDTYKSKNKNSARKERYLKSYKNS